MNSLERWASIPDVPTVVESGYPGFEAVAWFGFLAPANTPNAIIDKRYQNIVKAAGGLDVSNRFTEMGLVIVSRSPQAFAAQIKDEIAKKGQLIKDSGAKPD